jgi:hypothetical protein
MYQYCFDVRSPISISHIVIGSYLVTLVAGLYPAAGKLHKELAMLPDVAGIRAVCDVSNPSTST